MLRLKDIPLSHPVRPLRKNAHAKDRATCGTCGLSWDDGISTSMTPAPGARCPFEDYHREECETMTAKQKAKFLRALANDNDLLEVARLAIEDQLISMRDSRLAIVGRNNGLVCKERNGEASSVIRFGPEVGVAIALAAIADVLESSE